MSNTAAEHSLPKHLVAGPARALDAHANILPELTEWAAVYVPDGSKLDGAQLAAIFAHSRHLRGLARAHPHIIKDTLSGRAADVVATAMAELEAAASKITEEAAMIKAIRLLRQQSALAVALCDMAGMAPVDVQMGWLSAAAESALRAAVTYLFRRAARLGQIADETAITAHRMTGCGWVVLALGKLGAGELNYSSDIDLILLHDPIDNPLTDPKTSQATYVGMARDLVRLLSTSTDRKSVV